MLLPALNTARSRSRATNCLNNLKGIGQYCVFYYDDYGTAIISSSHNGGAIVGWGNHLVQLYGARKYYTSDYNKNVRLPTCAGTIFRCPQISPFNPIPANDSHAITSFAYNQQMVHNSNLATTPYAAPANDWGKLKYPSRTMLFVDGNGTGTINTGPTTYSRVDWRHLGSANYLFLDWHVEPLKNPKAAPVKGISLNSNTIL